MATTKWGKYRGKLDIGLPSGGRYDEKQIFRLTLFDESSSAVIGTLEITPEDLALGMTGRAQRAVEYTLNPYAPVLMGTTHEVKTEVVAFKSGHKHVADVESKRDTPEVAPLVAAVAPYEVEGWVARLSDLQNGHRSRGPGYQEVTFFRFVDDQGKPVIL